MQLQGSPAPGVTTGEAMAEMERLVGELGPGFELAWTGLSLEEREAGNQAPLLYALSLAAVFLRSPPLRKLVDPLRGHARHAHRHRRRADGRGWAGSRTGCSFRSGLLTVVGLVGKNAILIVEFARDRHEAGDRVIDAVAMAARQRFRPIIMTSMAFSLGVLPLVLSSGAGSGGRTAIGSGVLGGTISGTVLGVIFVPLFFMIVTRLFRRATSADTRQIGHRSARQRGDAGDQSATDTRCQRSAS